VSEHFSGVMGDRLTGMKTLTPNRIRVARLIAISADLLQLGLFPLFAEGFVSPLNDILDVVVCILLTLLVGWHYAFLPSLVAEIVPMFDLVPTWTIAIFLATRQKQTSPAPATTVVVDTERPTAGQIGWPAK
jgi:hypothetical protein